jgi:hypothetical protein
MYCVCVCVCHNFFRGHYLELQSYNLHKTVPTFSCTPYLSLKPENGVEMIIFTFERSIRAEVVTYRLDDVFGFLHTQQLRGFDESRYDQGIIQNCSVKIKTIVASLYLPASNFIFRILRLAPQNRANEKWQKSCFFNDSHRSELSL